MRTIAEMKPSWKILGFDERIEDIPEEVSEWQGRFEMGKGPRGRIVSWIIIGSSLVYRVFTANTSCGRDKLFISREGLREVKRYVFTKIGIIVENRDRTREMIDIKDLLKVDDLIDVSVRKDGKEREREYEIFALCVDIPFKAGLLRGLKALPAEYPLLYFPAFAGMYARAANSRHVPEKTSAPECIRYDLYHRDYPTPGVVKLAENVTLVVGLRRKKGYEHTVQTRVYFDSEKAYFFSRNDLSWKWQTENLETRLGDEYFGGFAFFLNDRHGEVQRDLFDHTYAERFTRGGDTIDSSDRILFKEILARMYYPALEQADKIDRLDLYVELLDEIAANGLSKEQTLAEAYGITVPQLKFLEHLDMPRSVRDFRELIKRADIREAFPDIQKRIFAVCIFCRQTWGRGVEESEILKLFLEAAPTVYSLERVKTEKRNEMVQEYMDYLKMYCRMKACLENPEGAGELEADIRAFGEFKVNMKPSKIRDNHYRLSRLAGVVKDKPLLLKCSPKIRERKKREVGNFEYATEKYLIRMPEEAEEIVAEGRLQQHCVGGAGYIEAMADGRTTILFLRKRKAPDTPVLTMEVKNGAITQCYGFRDRLNDDPEIAEFLRDYAEKRNYRIVAPILREKNA